MGDCEAKREREELERSQESSWQYHNNLREVEIHNFQGDEAAVELVVSLVNSSPTIGKVKIDRRFFIHEGDGECSVYGFPIGIKRKQVLKMLSRRISADTSLIVL